jgi:hypothetical protein
MPTRMAEPTTPARVPIICMILSATSSLARYCIAESSGTKVSNPLVAPFERYVSPPGLGLGLIASKIVTATGEVLG